MLGLGFVVSGLLLFYSIVLILDAVYESGPGRTTANPTPALFARDVLARFLTLVAALYLYLGLSDYEDIRYGSSFRIHALDLLVAMLVVIQLITNLVLYPHWTREKAKETMDVHADSATSADAASEAPNRPGDVTGRIGVVGLAVTLTCVIGFGVYEARADLCPTCSPVIVVAILLATAIFDISFTYYLARSRPSAIARNSWMRSLGRRVFPIRPSAATRQEP
jgi:membrane protein YdbS with pleckstrin-like domain